MALKFRKKINTKIKLMYHQSKYPAYRRLLRVRLSFEYGCSSLFPLLTKNLKLRLQKAQNKCIRFTLNLPPRSHIDPSHFRKITGFRLVTEQNTVLQIPFLSTGKELYQNIFMKCFSLRSPYIVQDDRWHWTYLCGKQTRQKKLILLKTKNMVQRRPQY